MMKYLVHIVIFLICATTHCAHAQSTYTVSQVLRMLDAPGQKEYAQAYVLGVLDSVLAMNAYSLNVHGRTVICLPHDGSISAKALVSSIRSSTESNKTLRNYSFDVLAITWLSQKYPC